MGKDRLAEMQAASKHVKEESKDEEELKPLKKKDQMNSSQEDFFDTLQDITSSIDTLNEKVSETKKLQKKILNSVHSDANEKAKLADLHETNKQLGRKIQNLLKKEQEKLEKKASPKKKQADGRIRNTQISSQSTRFFNIWNDYNESQVEFREKSKRHLVNQCKVTGNVDLSAEQIEEMLDEGKTNMFATSILDQERVAKQQLLDLQMRHGEFLKLEKQIEECRDLFMDIANLVQSQGEMVDNIYQNVAKAEIDVEQGKNHLGKAEEFMRSARKKKVICFAIIAVVVLIILLVILIEFGAFSYSSSDYSEPVTTTSTTTSKPTDSESSEISEFTPEVPPTLP